MTTTISKNKTDKKIISDWHDEASILVGKDPEVDSEDGRRLVLLLAILQEYERAKWPHLFSHEKKK